MPVRGRIVEFRFHDVGSRHAVLEFCRRIERHEQPVVHDRDPVAEPVGFVHVMRRQQDGQAGRFFQLVDHFPDGAARDRIEARRRLVEEEDLRRMYQAARNFQAPSHPAGKASDQLVGEIAQAHRFQQLRDQFLALGARQAV